jgi:hypothetical protein
MQIRPSPLQFFVTHAVMAKRADAEGRPAFRIAAFEEIQRIVPAAVGSATQV